MDASDFARGRRHKLQFPTHLREHFEREAGFTDEELEVFRLRARGKSIVQIAMATCCSEPTVERRLRSIKKKIAAIL